MNENQFERLVVAFESLADTLGKWYNRTYPDRPKLEARITRVKTDEDRQREEQGDTGEQTLGEWTDIGRHETDFLSKQKVGPRGSED